MSLKTELDKIDFGRRLNEIIDARHGKDKTQFLQDLAQKLDISPRTLYRSLNENRPLTHAQQEVVASELRVTYDRLMQNDAKALKKQLNELLLDAKNGDNQALKQALKVAQEKIEISIGQSELCEAKNDLGKVYFEMRDFDAANDNWSDAFEIAQTMKDGELMYISCNNLLHALLEKKRYGDCERLLQQSEEYIKDDPVKVGRMEYFLGAISFRLNALERALYHFNASLDAYRNTKDDEQIGIAMNNVGMVFYRTKNYEKSLEFQKEAVLLVRNSPLATRLLIVESLVESLIRLGHKADALDITKKSLRELKEKDEPNLIDLKGRFLLLQSNISKAPDYAEAALMLNISEQTNLKINEFLRDFYLRTGDCNKALYYHENIQCIENN